MFAIFLSDAMDPFYQNIASFPTVVFTFPLIVCLLYWLVAVLGLVDLDVLDLDVPEGDLDGGSDTGANALAGLLLKLGLTGVPLTIVISFLSLFGWLISYFLVHFGFQWIPGGILQYLAGIPVVIASLYIAVLITAQVIKPLRPFFANMYQETVKHVLGQTAIVRSSRVDAGFGEVLLADGGAGLIFKARTTGDETFAKGDRVVLLEYLEAVNAYRVISEDEFLN